MKITLATLLAAGLLAACGDNSDDEVTDIDTPEDNEEDFQVEEDETDGVQEESEDEEEKETETGSNDSDSVVSSSFEDQEDLRIGDTAQISSNLGEYEITINSLEKKDEVDGEASMFDYFILAEVTIKNISAEEIKVENPVGILELNHDIEGSGSGDYSEHFDSVEEMQGSLAPDEEITGEVLFEARDSEEMYIMVNSGLIASGGVHNNAIWTFDVSEAE